MKSILFILMVFLFSSCSAGDKQTDSEALPHISPPTSSIAYTQVMNLTQEFDNSDGIYNYILNINNDTVLINQMYDVTDRPGQLCNNTSRVITYSLKDNVINRTYDIKGFNLSVFNGVLFNGKILLSGVYRQQPAEGIYTWFIIEIADNDITVLAKGDISTNGEAPEFLQKGDTLYTYYHDLKDNDKTGIYSYSPNGFETVMPIKDNITCDNFYFNINGKEIFLHGNDDKNSTILKLENGKITKTDILPLYLRGFAYTDSGYIYTYYDPDNAMHNYLVYQDKKYTAYDTIYITEYINGNLFYEENSNNSLCVIHLNENSETPTAQSIYPKSNKYPVIDVFYDKITGNYYFYTDEALCKIDI